MTKELEKMDKEIKKNYDVIIDDEENNIKKTLEGIRNQTANLIP